MPRIRLSRPLVGLLSVMMLGLLIGPSLLARQPNVQPSPMRDAEPADLGAIDDACETINPYFTTVILGRQDGAPDPDRPAIIAYRYTGDEQLVLATEGEVGDVLGLAYDHTRHQLYASAYLRRGGSFGPGGPGQIYRIDLESGQVEPFVTLDAGPDPRLDPDAAEDGSTTAALVAKTGLGDMDIAADGSELYVMNIALGKIERISLPDGRVLPGMAHGAARESWRFDARPFGLGVHDGMVYHGVVNGRENTARPEVFQGVVYRADPNGGSTEQVVAFGLDYTRTFGGVRWQPWRDDANGRGDDSPMISDIEFAADGLPIIGLRDRQADMVPNCVWNPACRAGPSAGDVLPVRLNNGGPNLTVLRSPAWYRDSGPDNIDLTFGMLAGVPGLDILVAPARSRDGNAAEVQHELHAFWFANGNGGVLRDEPIVMARDASGDPTIEDLAPGDTEVLCGPREPGDPVIATTATAEAGAIATATAVERGRVRATQYIATQTAHAPIRSARKTAAATTATAIAPTLEAERPTNEAASTLAAGTAAAVAPMLTRLAPTTRALQTEAAKNPVLPMATATAATVAYANMNFSCGGDNPYLVTTCFVPHVDGNGRDYPSSWLRSQPVLVGFNDSEPEDSLKHFVLAHEGDVGAVMGTAYDLDRDHVYVAAYAKRLSAYGPLGPGGVYRVDLESGRVSPFAMLVAGFDAHRMQNGFDQPMAGLVGRSSLGDIEISEDNDQLFVSNLDDKMIYRISVPDGNVLGMIPHGAAGQWWSKDAVLFGLAFRDGFLYHGVIDTLTEQVEDEVPDEDRRPYRTYIYRSLPDGSEMKEVARIDMNYPRNPAWQPWEMRRDDTSRRPEPMPADIEFRVDGDLIVGMRDRTGDARILVAGSGDVVLTMQVEGADRFIALTVPEVYRDNNIHREASWGSMASLPWLDEIVVNILDPIRIYSGGAYWFENVSGQVMRREEIYSGRNRTFGKSSGLGDIEAVCAPLTLTPTPTPSSTITPTPRLETATSTPTASQTASLTPTGTPTSYEIYLPFGNKDEFCPKDAFFTDVVLVLDRSTSMLRAVEPGGIPKNEAAIAAAKSFVGNLDFTPDWRGRHDQVAVVGFNDNAWIESDLTADPATALAALDRIGGKTQEGTRLDLAFTWGQKPLDGSMRRPENRPVIIMLTDGLPNRVPFGDGSPYPGSRRQEDSVLMAVDVVKATGSRVYTVGLGTPRDILPWLLIDCASERWMYHYAPRPEELAGIYGQIARTFDSCDPKPAPTPCSPEFQHADVVLVLDMSTSMYRETRSGRAKYEAAIAAAHEFVDQLDLERDGWGRRDQVAIVGFNGSAWTSIGLGDDRGAIQRAIDNLEDEISEGTRLDLALAEGQRVYEIGERLQPNEPVMILLTDGLPNQVPFGAGSPHPECDRQECTVLKIASQVKQKGTRVYTIGLGLGDDVLRPLMENVATDASMYYHAPDGEDLAGIYRQIAGRLSDCP